MADTFKESILIPKSFLESLIKKENNKKSDYGTAVVNSSTPMANIVFETKELQKEHFPVKKKKVQFEDSFEKEINKEHEMKIQTLLRMFPYSLRYKISYLLNFIYKQVGTRFKWNSSFQMAIDKRFFPESNLVDILTFLYSENTTDFMSEENIRLKEGHRIIGVPRDVDVFVDFLKTLPGVVNMKAFHFLFSQLNKFRAYQNSLSKLTAKQKDELEQDPDHAFIEYVPHQQPISDEIKRLKQLQIKEKLEEEEKKEEEDENMEQEEKEEEEEPEEGEMDDGDFESASDMEVDEGEEDNADATAADKVSKDPVAAAAAANPLPTAPHPVPVTGPPPPPPDAAAPPPPDATAAVIGPQPLPPPDAPLVHQIVAQHDNVVLANDPNDPTLQDQLDAATAAAPTSPLATGSPSSTATSPSYADVVKTPKGPDDKPPKAPNKSAKSSGIPVRQSSRTIRPTDKFQAGQPSTSQLDQALTYHKPPKSGKAADKNDKNKSTPGKPGSLIGKRGGTPVPAKRPAFR